MNIPFGFFIYEIDISEFLNPKKEQKCSNYRQEMNYKNKFLQIYYSGRLCSMAGTFSILSTFNNYY